MNAAYPGQRQRSAWQRCAAVRLVEILEANRDLPVIVWTIAAAGSGLSGDVSALVAAGEARSVFHAWHRALALGEPVQTSLGSGASLLRAAGCHDRVRVALRARVQTPGGGQ